MTPAIEFLFDFGSPNAYLCHKVLPQVVARTGAPVVYVPILLGGVFKATNNRSPMEAFAGIPNKLAYERRDRERFIEKHQLTAFKHNPHFPVNTLQIMRGAVAAQKLGVYAEYIDAMFASMWERGAKMDDPAVIASELKAAGLDADALIAKSQEADVKAELLTSTQRAVERGAFGSPTFFVGNEMYFGKERLRDVEEALANSAGKCPFMHG